MSREPVLEKELRIQVYDPQPCRSPLLCQSHQIMRSNVDPAVIQSLICLLGWGVIVNPDLSLDENHKSPGFWNSEVRDRMKSDISAAYREGLIFILPHLNSD